MHFCWIFCCINYLSLQRILADDKLDYCFEIILFLSFELVRSYSILTFSDF
jgi:hypothetical protein